MQNFRRRRLLKLGGVGGVADAASGSRLDAIIRHNESTTRDYLNHFNLDMFSILDHFLLCSGIFDNLVDRAYVDYYIPS
jgi:hypothetical protein